jgi:hypothetical protein
MCTVLLPPGVNTIAVNKYIISYISYIIPRFLLLFPSIYAKVFQLALSFRFPTPTFCTYLSSTSHACYMRLSLLIFFKLDRPNNIWLLPYSWAQQPVRELLCTRFSTQRNTNTRFPATSAYELFLEKNTPTPPKSPLTQT